jgi:transposase InsO family protein
MVLLSTCLFILFVPFIPLAATRPVEIHEIIGAYEFWLLPLFYLSPEIPLNQPVFTWAHVAVIIYVAGITFFSLRYLYFLIRIIGRIRSGEKICLDPAVTLVISDKSTTPFSWMRYIVLSKKDYAENRNNILPHERAHIKYRHSIDLLIADLLAVIQWYNPVIWLMKNELQDVHEYEADEAVLRSGINPKEYQLLLIEKAVGSPCFNSMTNSFNHSKLKKRITMMLKEKNARWARLKYLGILPLAALAVVLFARPEVSTTLDEISAVKVSDFTSMNEVNTESFASAPSQPAKEQSKPAKTKPAPDDSLTIVKRLKEWEEFFRTTSPKEFKEMMTQLQRRKQSQNVVIQSDSMYANLKPFSFHVNDTTWSKRLRRMALSGDSITLLSGKLCVDSLGNIRYKYSVTDSLRNARYKYSVTDSLRNVRYKYSVTDSLGTIKYESCKPILPK